MMILLITTAVALSSPLRGRKSQSHRIGRSLGQNLFVLANVTYDAFCPTGYFDEFAKSDWEFYYCIEKVHGEYPDGECNHACQQWINSTDCCSSEETHYANKITMVRKKYNTSDCSGSPIGTEITYGLDGTCNKLSDDYSVLKTCSDTSYVSSKLYWSNDCTGDYAQDQMILNECFDGGCDDGEECYYKYTSLSCPAGTPNEAPNKIKVVWSAYSTSDCSGSPLYTSTEYTSAACESFTDEFGTIISSHNVCSDTSTWHSFSYLSNDCTDLRLPEGETHTLNECFHECEDDEECEEYYKMTSLTCPETQEEVIIPVPESVTIEVEHYNTVDCTGSPTYHETHTVLVNTCYLGYDEGSITSWQNMCLDTTTFASFAYSSNDCTGSQIDDPETYIVNECVLECDSASDEECDDDESMKIVSMDCPSTQGASSAALAVSTLFATFLISAI